MQFKLPMCLHCGKLAVGHLAHLHYISESGEGVRLALEYLCPELLTPVEPSWVEVTTLLAPVDKPQESTKG